jgi:hypothetical protein
MSQQYTQYPTTEEAKLDARELMEFLFSGNADNKKDRSMGTIEDAERLAAFANS